MEIFDILGKPNILVYKMESHREDQHSTHFLLNLSIFHTSPLEWMLLLSEQQNMGMAGLLFVLYVPEFSPKF